MDFGRVIRISTYAVINLRKVRQEYVVDQMVNHSERPLLDHSSLGYIDSGLSSIQSFVCPHKETNMGSLVKVVERTEEGDWRSFIRRDKTKFNDELKALFLSELRQHARIKSALTVCDISYPTYAKHMTADKEFAQAVYEAQMEYRDRLIAHHQNLVFEGTERITYAKDGSVVGTETIYPIQLIAMELRKHDEGYRDKREVDVNVNQGGVVVAPAAVASIDDWEKRYGAPVEGVEDAVIIEGELVDSDALPVPSLGSTGKK